MMTLEEERKFLTKELENIFTIDGRGRPTKARLFLELMDCHGKEMIFSILKEFGERKFF